MPASTLIVQLPPRPRQGGSPVAASTESLEQVALTFVVCDERQHLLQHGVAPLAELPDAAQCWAVLDVSDVAWHRLEAVPRAPSAKLRAALAGLLEERLLDDEATLHMALAPQWRPGEPAWVAVTQQAWLQAWLTALEQHVGSVARVLPALSPRDPGAPPLAHVTGRSQQAWVEWADERGVLTLPLASLSVQRLRVSGESSEGHSTIQWSASPEAQEVAAQYLGEAVSARSAVQQLMVASHSDWNVRQFQLAPRHRTDRWLRAGWQRVLQDPGLRSLRWAGAVLVGANLLGAGAWAWQQQHALAERKQAMNALLQTTFPQVRAIVDAPLQMTRAFDVLRWQAGQPGEADLETLLAAAHHVWPDGMPPAQGLQFEMGRLRIQAPGWSAQQVESVRPLLWPLGLDAQAVADGWVIQPLKGEPDRRGLNASPAARASATRPSPSPPPVMRQPAEPPQRGRHSPEGLARRGGEQAPDQPPEDMSGDAPEEATDEDSN